MIQTKLTITVTKTANGEADYLQVMSADQFAINIVLIAEQIEIEDLRPKEPKHRKKREK